MDAWKKAMKKIIDEGDTISAQPTFKDIRNLSIKINKPEEDITLPIKALSSIQKWIYPSLSEIKTSIFSKSESKDYPYLYGQRIFNFAKSVDQINDFVIPLLKKDPYTRKAYVSLMNPFKDSYLDAKYLIGLIGIHFRIINSKLDIIGIIRSNNMFSGWPANVYQLYLLQRYVADKLSIPAGALHTISLSAHIFLDDIEEIRKVI